MIDKSNENNNQQTFMNLTEIVENEFCDEIVKNEFFEMIDYYKIDLESLYRKRVENNRQMIKKFNMFLLRYKNVFGLDIKDSLIFIEERYMSFSKMILVLDDTNMNILKKEMAEYGHIKLPKNNLKKFFSEVI